MMRAVARWFSLLLLAALGGCTAFVAGDLRATPDGGLYDCDVRPADTQFLVRIKSRDDWGRPNISSIVSGLTLGLAPTYWYSPVKVTVDVKSRGTVTTSYHYKSGIHYFYGMPWNYFLPVRSINEIPIQPLESGMYARQTFTAKALGRTLAQPEFANGEPEACKIVDVRER